MLFRSEEIVVEHREAGRPADGFRGFVSRAGAMALRQIRRLDVLRGEQLKKEGAIHGPG